MPPQLLSQHLCASGFCCGLSLWVTGTVPPHPGEGTRLPSHAASPRACSACPTPSPKYGLGGSGLPGTSPGRSAAPWGDSGPRQLPGARGAPTAPLCRETQPGPGRTRGERQQSCSLPLLRPAQPKTILFSPFSGHAGAGAAHGCCTGMWLPQQPPDEWGLQVWAGAWCSVTGVRVTRRATAMPSSEKSLEMPKIHATPPLWQCPQHQSLGVQPVGVHQPPPVSSQHPEDQQKGSGLSPSSHGSCCGLVSPA